MKLSKAKEIIEDIIYEDLEYNNSLENMLFFLEYSTESLDYDINNILLDICNELYENVKNLDKFIFAFQDGKISFNAMKTGKLLGLYDNLFEDIYESSQIYYHLKTFMDSQIYLKLQTPPYVLSKIYYMEKQSTYTIKEAKNIMENKLQPLLRERVYDSMLSKIDKEYDN